MIEPIKSNCQPLEYEEAECWLKLSLLEANEEKVSGERPPYNPDPDNPLPHLSEIVHLRVKGMELPIQFTREALLAITLIADRPACSIIILADCLHKYKDKLVGMAELSTLYPWGFYKPEVAEKVWGEVKKKQRPWAEIA